MSEGKNTTCGVCGAVAPAGTVFRVERIPFRRSTRICCPTCQAKMQDRTLLGLVFLNLGFGLVGALCLLVNQSSTFGHVFVNLSLFELVLLPSYALHEFAHAFVGKLAGLTVLRIWIGRGKTVYRANILGFDSEIKNVPFGGITFFAHKTNEYLRFRYFLTILAGPAINALMLAVAWRYASFHEFDLENSIHFAAITALMQAIILIENLLPYRTRTTAGRMGTDGLSLYQLIASESPEVLRQKLLIPNTESQNR
jgi:hypothetical protein